MKEYFEAHITMIGNIEAVKPLVERLKWKFSAIEGDINLGNGIKLYATRQFNVKIGKEKAIKTLLETANLLQSKGVSILRRKIELVIFDDRSSLVGTCTGGCIECNQLDYIEAGILTPI